MKAGPDEGRPTRAPADPLPQVDSNGRPFIVAGLLIVLLVFGGVGTWAAVAPLSGRMRPSKTEPEGSGDLFRARLDQIINMKHELVRLADAIDWDWIDAELADCFADQGRPGTEVRFMAGLLLLKHIYGLSDRGCASVGCTTPISSTSPARRSSGTTCRTSALG